MSTSLSAAEIVELSRKHSLFEWSAQSAVDPIPVASAKGSCFFTPDGKRFLDFNSQLMSVNIGHGDPRVVRAIQKQVETLAYANPYMAHEPRALLGKRLAEICPGDIDKFFFTNGGADANENAIKLARLITGRHKIAARYRSYHGGTAGAMTLTGDPRRWPAEPGIPGVIRIPEFHKYGRRDPEPVESVLRETEDVLMFEGEKNVAAILVESVVGTNGILVPPDGYMQGLRAICDKHGIMLICDEVMCGFGRTGKWFAVNHWNVVPDMITMAKGLTSSYVPLGAVGMRSAHAKFFDNNVLWGGLTYNSHPMGCAAALANLDVYVEDKLIERAAKMGELMKKHHEALRDKHPCVGAGRNIGLFGLLELVKNKKTYEPLAPFNGHTDEVKAIAKHLRDNGLYTFVRWNTIMTNPPLCVTEEEMAEGFKIIDEALSIADKSCTG